MDNSIQTARRQVGIWLAAGILMVIIQILLGGITRLTGSGLSITEWKPLMGALPPLSHTEWRCSFEQYQHIAQFKKLNNQFTLADYQGLYFWEWLHREWARLMGVVFIIPFCVFLWQGKFTRSLGWRLAGLFLLGAVQGLAGWVMVQSGLNDTDVTVSHIRLAVHLFLAVLLLVYLFWMFLTLRTDKAPAAASGTLQLLTQLIMLLLGLQFIYGAFMAGTHAALYAPTWPDINGSFILSSPGITGNFLHRVAYDPFLIQFIHRLLAYLLSGLFLTWFFYIRRLPAGSPLRRRGSYSILLLILQVSLGIASLLNSSTPIFIWLAVMHQLNGIVLLLNMVSFFHRIRNQSVQTA
ncbi:MAG: COX15/CtaA family protein [Mucilaginibacter sp.]